VPNVEIEWWCIKNDMEKANKNCIERKNKGNPQGHIHLNEKWSKCYTYPEVCMLKEVWTN